MDFSSFQPIKIPVVQDSWTGKDIMGALKVRCSIGRNNYSVQPGLYKIGNPSDKDEVFVSANYKLSFDILRKNLKGINAWILVLQTKGINVWCAAGKGTFGTNELIKQIRETQLHLYVAHRRIIAPQLGAPGIAAHIVKAETGYTVKFGPVRAQDIPAYLRQGLKKDVTQRTVKFNFTDRLIHTPVEVVNNLKNLAIAILFIGLLAGLSAGHYSLSNIKDYALKDISILLFAYFTGTILTPIALPLLPFKSFSGKGLVAGLLLPYIALFHHFYATSMFYSGGWILLSGAISSYLTMNFTGSSTYTSLSGVKKEMRFFVPLQISMALAGLALLIISKIMVYG